MKMAQRYYDSHDFTNNTNEVLSVMLEPGEIVEVRSGSRPLDVSRYSGEEFGYEVEVSPNESMRTIKFAD